MTDKGCPASLRCNLHCNMHTHTPASLTCDLQEMPNADVHRSYAAAQCLGALRAERAGSGGVEGRGHQAHWMGCGLAGDT